MLSLDWLLPDKYCFSKGHRSLIQPRQKKLHDARDCVAGFAPKVPEKGSEVPLIVFLERDAMVPGLGNVWGLLLDISYASGEGSSTNLCYIHIQLHPDGLSDGFT